MKKHYTIPFFIPHKGCAHKCVFCDQNRITGESAPDPAGVPGKIEKYISTMPAAEKHVEVGFFGGSFTGIHAELQEQFLKKAKPYLEKGVIQGIRLSTRPDMIDEKKVDFLKKNGVTCIELGIQSMSDKVLAASRRGHTAADAEKASSIILRAGLMLGHQMMLGLPSGSFEDEAYTAKCIKESGAQQARIYPTVVIDGTELAELWRGKKYEPISEEEAVERSARLISYFGSNGIKVIRCGLHPSRGLLSGEEYLAGPFHPAFGHKARTLAEKISFRI